MTLIGDIYYQKQLFLAQVDTQDKIIGRVERWEAHKKGILHRGFTTILMHQGKILLQQRKHPVFNRFWDLSFSSHQVYENNRYQIDVQAIINSLKREWNLGETDLISPPTFLGKIYYRAKDPKSIYIEHEYDYIYLVNLKTKPTPNLDFAYGYKIIDHLNSIWQIDNLGPWVKTMLRKIDLRRVDSL